MPELPALDLWEISIEQLDALLKNDPDAVRLIDCREDDEFTICSIEGAELLPLSSFAEKGGPILLKDDSRPAVIYCHHGMRSLNATMWVREHGKGDVWSLAGGIDQWATQVEPDMARY